MSEQKLKEQAKEAFKRAEFGTTGYIHGINIKNPEHLIMEWPMEGLKFEIMGGVNLKQLDRLRATLKVSRHPQLSPVHAFRTVTSIHFLRKPVRYSGITSRSVV